MEIRRWIRRRVQRTRVVMSQNYVEFIIITISFHFIFVACAHASLYKINQWLGCDQAVMMIICAHSEMAEIERGREKTVESTSSDRRTYHTAYSGPLWFVHFSVGNRNVLPWCPTSERAINTCIVWAHAVCTLLRRFRPFMRFYRRSHSWTKCTNLYSDSLPAPLFPSPLFRHHVV